MTSRLPAHVAPCGAVILDDRASSLFARSAPLRRLATGARWSEGPVWIAETQSVLWSDIPNDRILRWSASDGMTVWQQGVEFTNGHARDASGSLLHCSHGLRAVYRTGIEPGPREIVIDRYRGKRFNSPNDVVVKSDGTIWFTDPPYGLLVAGEGHGGEPELDDCRVYRFDPRSGEVTAVTDVPHHPNGLAFSPDESLLYVSDTAAALPGHGPQHCIYVFDVSAGSRLAAGRVFADIAPGVPDGFRVDADGRVWSSAADGVHVLDPDGTRIAFIPVPEKVGNLCFGGTGRDTLFIAASTSLYAIDVAVRGICSPRSELRPPPPRKAGTVGRPGGT